MVVTRFPLSQGFLHLFDASWAVFFLCGLWSRSLKELALGFFTLTFVSIGVDAVALGPKLVASYCMTPAYMGMPLAYLSLMLFGRLLQHSESQTQLNTLLTSLRLVCVALVASLVAFGVSNWLFYQFSGYFEAMTAGEYWGRVFWRYWPSYAVIMGGYALICHYLLPRAVALYQGSQAIENDAILTSNSSSKKLPNE